MNHQGPTSDNDKTRHNLNPSPPGADSQITAQSADLLAATQHSQKGEDRGDDRECDRRGCATSKSKQIETKDLEADERGVVESTAAGEGQATGLASQYSAPRLARNRRAAAIRKSLRDKKKTQTNLTATGVSASAMAEEAGSATSQTVRKNDVGPRTTRYQLRLGKDSCQVGAEAGSRMDHQEDKDYGPDSTIQMDEKMKEKETSKAADVGNGEKRSSSSSEDEFAFHGTQSRTLTPPRLHGNHVLSGNLNLEVLDATPPTKSNSNKHIINDSEMKMEKKKRSAAETPWRNFDKTKSYSGKLQPKHKQSKLYAGSSPLRRMAAKNHSDYDANADVGTHIHEIEAKRQTKQEKGVERPQQLQQHIVESKPHETKMDEIDEKIRPSSLIDTTIEIVMKPPIDSACKPNNHGGGHGKEWKVEKVEEEIENGNDYGGEEPLEFSPLTCPTQPFGDYIDEDVFDGDENDDNGVEDGNDDKKETGEDKTENEVGEKIMIEKVVEMDVAEGKFVRIEAENEKDADIIDMKNEDGNSKKDENNGNQNDAITNDRNRDGEREAGPISDDAQMSADFSVVNSKSNDRTGPVDEAENNAGNVGSSDMDDKGRLTTRILKNNTVGTNCNASGTMVGSAVVTRSHGRERMGQPKPTPASGITDLELKKRGRRFKKGATYKALAVLEENDEEDDGCKGKVINDDATVNDDHDYGHSFTDKGLDLQSSDRGKMLTKPEQEKAMLTESMMSPSLLPPPSNLNESSSSSDGADAAYSALAGATTSAAATAINRNPRQEFIIKVHSELENLGKALACPLCLHTLKEATILPCMHAYCGPCINSAFCPPPTDFKGRGRGRSKKKNSPPRHASDSCPICKFKCGRRSMVRSEHLDELVRGFKLTLRAFGLTPIEHGAGVQMTQLDPEEVDYGDEDDTEANDDVKIPAMNIPQSTAASISKTPAVHRGFDNHQPLPQRKKKADLVEYQQHLQVSKVVRDAFASAQLESIAGTNLPPDQNTIRRTSDRHQTPKLSLRITKEEIERQAKLQKYRILAQEQDAVVRADEEALNKVVRRRRGKKSDTTKTYLDGECDGPADEKNVHETTDNNYVQPEGEKAKHQTNPTTKEFNNHAIAESNVQKAAKSTPRKETETIFEEFCTAPEGSIYCTAREDSQTCAFTVNTAPSPVVVHDGNTAKAARPKRKFSAEFTGDERKSDYNQPKDVVETGRIRNQSITSAEFSPVKVHDGNTVRKSRHGSGSNLMLVDSQPKYPRPVLPGKELPRSETLKISNSEEAKTVQSNSETFPANKVALQQIDAAEDDNPVANTAHVEGDHDYPTIDETAKDTDVIRTKVSAVDIPPLENENIKGNDGANEVFTESQAQPIDREEIKKGSIVMVQSRFWPGINKPGGVARVVTVHQAPGNSLKYDVAYVLGGREKKVDESFVSLHNMTASTHESGGLEANGNGHCIETSSSLESRQARMRSASTTRRKEPTSAPAAISNLSKEALKEIPADVLEWAGIVSVQSKKKARTRSKSSEKSPKKANSPSTTTKKKASRHNKRALQESTNVIAAKKSKKLTFVPKTSFLSQAAFTQTDQENIPPRNTNESPPEVIRQVALTLSTKEIMDLASKRYSSLLCFPPATDTPTPTTIYTVTSSLSDGDTDALVSLCKILKANKVNIKIMKEFQPNTTMLCITSTAGGSPSTACQTSSLIDVIVSKTRTSKVMRSALAGIPIVTPAWIDECLKESRVVAPAEKLFVNTLPMRRATKVCDNDESQEDGIQLASFGVAKYAAQIQRAQSEGIRAKGLLDGIGVMMCGTWKMIPSPMKKDLKILLHEAGATKITSVSTMSRALSNIANGGSEFERVVFLCDDSVSDKSCGISESLLNEAKFAINSGKIRQDVVMAVNFNWLFDCISCAALMPSKMYEPVAPRAKELWNLTYNEDV